jgi:tRNA threonylcarbamoyladenosine biosynthesis protein TsaB
MAIILNLETAGTNCSVSVAKDGQLLSVTEDNSPGYSHSEQLHPFIEAAMAEAGLELGSLHAIAVSKGPGSYTGLRIGVSAAKGLCYALGVPLVSVPTLESLARQLKVKDGVLIPMLDARRMEVYAAVYSSDYTELRATRAEIINPGSFEGYMDSGKVYLLGSGATKCKGVLDHPNLVIHEDLRPSAREMAVISHSKFEEGDFEDLAYFEPFYLKDFMAPKKKSAGPSQ